MPKYDRELIARMLETPSVFEDASRREQARLLREAENLEADARTVVREVTDGMVLVPREPTLEMCNAAWRDLESQGIDPEDVEVAQIFQAMLSAASGEGVG